MIDSLNDFSNRGTAVARSALLSVGPGMLLALLVFASPGCGPGGILLVAPGTAERQSVGQLQVGSSGQLQITGSKVTAFDIAKRDTVEVITVVVFEPFELTGQRYTIGCSMEAPNGGKAPKRLGVGLQVSNLFGQVTHTDSARVRVRKNGNCKIKIRTFADGVIPARGIAQVTIKPLGRGIPAGTEITADFSLLG